jgi:hypothetical protein
MYFQGPNLDKYKKHFWICAKCGCKNDVDNSDCQFCKTGVDPEIERDKLHNQNFKIMVKCFVVLMFLSIIVFSTIKYFF